jgi:hypothetical protein
VEEAMEEVANQNLKLGLVPPRGWEACLYGKRLDGVIPVGEESIALSHAAPP